MTAHIPFFKYQGTGNDFVMIDNRQGHFPYSKELVAAMCHRRLGIGADGLILIEEANGYDFRMRYYNADGGEGSMCGNGGRCAVQFAHFLGIFDQQTHFIAVDGPHEATRIGTAISLKMLDVSEIAQGDGYYFLNTGSPHYVAFVDDLSQYPVVAEGKRIRYGAPFVSAGGTNVNFMSLDQAPNSLCVRTYERGVEDETFSCGTGVTACALVAAVQEGVQSPVSIQTTGGLLQVKFEKKSANSFQNIYLQGPAIQVFEGQWPLPKQG
nr:diaminopimelate epimerase [Eisenibacter elegans]